MEFFFPEATLGEIKDALEHTLKDMKDLPVDVKITVPEEFKLKVEISKWGTSTLTFMAFPLVFNNEEGYGVVLSGEDIASLHKGVIDQVKEKFVEIVKQSGGDVIAS